MSKSANKITIRLIGILLFSASLAEGSLAAQPAPSSAPAKSVLQQHFEEAQRLQASGKLPDAAREYRIFIADALSELALRHAHLGDYTKAAPLFDEALRLAPNSPGLKVRYAEAALAARDYPRTRTLCEGILRDYPSNTKAVAKAHLYLGRALQRTNQESAAKDQFEAAVVLEPDFDNGYALAIAYLDLGDGDSADKVFAEMLTGLGDSAALRMEIGRAYLNSDFQPSAIPQLQKALTLNPRLPGLHYLLAIAYLQAGGEDSLTLAAPQLQAELKISPNDAGVHVQLGNIAFRQHNYDEAIRELQKALTLDPTNPDAFLFLGQLYNETGRSAEAITALRQSIASTKDPSYNRYQVQKAHYLLGRLLIQSGQQEAGKQEMHISSELLNQSLRKDRNRLAGTDANPTETTAAATPAPDAKLTPAASELQEFESRLTPGIADAYNNLGAISAGDGSSAEALVSFEDAFIWNPALEGLDANWGKVAFLSGKYAEAIPHLSRHLQAAPNDDTATAELAVSQFMTGNYPATLTTLQPVRATLDQKPTLAVIYAASLEKTGHYDEAVKTLLSIRNQLENNAQFHAVLGEAYAGQKDWPNAAREQALYEKLQHAKDHP